MRIILHIGMPKAGSSALQSGLFDIREQLAEFGVLYPVGDRMPVNHEFLVHGCTERLPRWVRKKYQDDTDKVGRALTAWLESLKGELDTKKYHTLILSGENLFEITSDEGLGRLSDRLRYLGGDDATVAAVAYVRRPSDHYVSSVQQVLKASHNVSKPKGRRFRPTLEGYEKHVADRVQVIKYDRTEWPDGHILRHFLQAFLPEAAGIEPPSQEVNSSLSMEAMAVLQEYRKAFHADENNRFTHDTRLLTQQLRAADAEVPGFRRPRLHEHISAEVDQSSVDLRWLKDEYGIVFDGVGYGSLREPDPRIVSAVRDVADICPVDDERKQALQLRALHELAKTTARLTAAAKPGKRKKAATADGR